MTHSVCRSDKLSCTFGVPIIDDGLNAKTAKAVRFVTIAAFVAIVENATETVFVSITDAEASVKNVGLLEPTSIISKMQKQKTTHLSSLSTSTKLWLANHASTAEHMKKPTGSIR